MAERELGGTNWVEQMRSDNEALREALEDCVSALRAIRDNGPGLIAQHGDALDKALCALYPSRDLDEPSVSTRTPERGLSYHDGTEALREALETLADPKWWWDNMGWVTWYGESPDGNEIVGDDPREIARRALAQHVGGEG